MFRAFARGASQVPKSGGSTIRKRIFSDDFSMAIKKSSLKVNFQWRLFVVVTESISYSDDYNCCH